MLHFMILLTRWFRLFLKIGNDGNSRRSNHFGQILNSMTPSIFHAPHVVDDLLHMGTVSPIYVIRYDTLMAKLKCSNTLASR